MMSAIDTKPLAALQKRLAKKVNLTNHLPAWDKIQTVAGCDISCQKHGKIGYAAIVVLSFPHLEIVDQRAAVGPLAFPYIPGFLSFRELPLLLECWEAFQKKPDAVICDAQGIAHPRGIGLASHFGVVTGATTIGCAKSRLIGTFKDPGNRRGCRTSLLLDERKVGEVVRTRDGVQPLFISPGHRIDFEHASKLILRLTNRYRQPEPIRAAHRLVNELRTADNPKI
ncbi:MAG: deoxyribonuclease V [bacterium]